MGCGGEGGDRKPWQLESYYPPDACRLSEALHVAGPRYLHSISHPRHHPLGGGHHRGGEGRMQHTFRGGESRNLGWFGRIQRVHESWGHAARMLWAMMGIMTRRFMSICDLAEGRQNMIHLKTCLSDMFHSCLTSGNSSTDHNLTKSP